MDVTSIILALIGLISGTGITALFTIRQSKKMSFL